MNQSVYHKAISNLTALENGIKIFHGCKLAYGCIVGSHAYGTATANSDIDVRGVFVRNAFDILTNHDPQNLSSSTTDTVLYSFDNFVKMLANGNPNIVDMVGVDKEFRLCSSPEMQLVFDNMHLFMSKRMGIACRGFANKQRKIFENKTSFELDKDKLGKAMMHYVRTMHNGIHTLFDGNPVACETDPEVLIKIRSGYYIDPVTMRPVEKFFRIMDMLEKDLDSALKLDRLPEEPHYSEINRLLAEVNARALGIAPNTYFKEEPNE